MALKTVTVSAKRSEGGRRSVSLGDFNVKGPGGRLIGDMLPDAFLGNFGTVDLTSLIERASLEAQNDEDRPRVSLRVTDRFELNLHDAIRAARIATEENPVAAEQAIANQAAQVRRRVVVCC